MEIEMKESAGPYIEPKSGELKIKTIQVAGDQNRKRLELGKLYSSQKDIICITLFNSSDLSYIFELILHDYEKCSQDIHCFFQVNHRLSWRQDNGDRSARTQLSRQHLARAGWGIFFKQNSEMFNFASGPKFWDIMSWSWAEEEGTRSSEMNIAPDIILGL